MEIKLLLLLILYFLILGAQITLLVFCIKRKKYWVSLFLLELFSILGALITMHYYNNLPGYGFMPGLSYLGEVLFSFGALILYSVMFFISLILKIVIFLNHKKKV